MCISKNVNDIVYPYRNCHVNVNNKDSAVQCDICQSLVHVKCNKLNHIDYKYLRGSNEPWYCVSCCSKIFPFGTLTNKDFIPSITNSLSVCLSVSVSVSLCLSLSLSVSLCLSLSLSVSLCLSLSLSVSLCLSLCLSVSLSTG